jgi:hypothetical protein
MPLRADAHLKIYAQPSMPQKTALLPSHGYSYQCQMTALNSQASVGVSTKQQEAVSIRSSGPDDTSLAQMDIRIADTNVLCANDMALCYRGCGTAQ